MREEHSPASPAASAGATSAPAQHGCSPPPAARPCPRPPRSSPLPPQTSPLRCHAAELPLLRTRSRTQAASLYPAALRALCKRLKLRHLWKAAHTGISRSFAPAQARASQLPAPGLLCMEKCCRGGQSQNYSSFFGYSSTPALLQPSPPPTPRTAVKTCSSFISSVALFLPS